jgi:hypothetical protein
VHDELHQLLPKPLPVLPGLGIALEFGFLLLCALPTRFLPEVLLNISAMWISLLEIVKN